jgi:hypothetical protein
MDLEVLVGQPVVLDLASPWVYVGTLAAVGPDYLVLQQADAHDLRDTTTTREQYIRNCRLHGVNPNRGQVWINRRELVGLSLLADVIAE